MNYIPIDVTVINKYTVSALLEGEMGNFCATSGIKQNCKTGLTKQPWHSQLHDFEGVSSLFNRFYDHFTKNKHIKTPNGASLCIFPAIYCQKNHFVHFNNYIGLHVNSGSCVKDPRQDLIRSIHCHNTVSIMLILMTGSTDAF